MKLLTNKVAIVTGAGSGIGRAIALALSREGAQVVISDINEKGGMESTELIKKEGGSCLFVLADISKPEDCQSLVDTTMKQYGGLHIAINNAGVAGPIQPTGEYPIDGWDKVISINLSGVFYGMRYQIPAMLKSGGGSIINISSILGMVGTKFSPAYVAAKHGVLGLTKTAAIEYAQQNIRVNTVGPAYIKTPLLEMLDEQTIQAIAALHPMGRLGTSEEVAELVLWLCSDKASFVTGSYYAVDGGYLSQ